MSANEKAWDYLKYDLDYGHLFSIKKQYVTAYAER